MDSVIELVKRFRVAVLTGAGVLLAAIILYAAFIGPQGTKLAGLRSREMQLQSQQAQLQSEIATLRHEKDQMATNCSDLTKALGEIPGAPDVDSFLQEITTLAVASGDPNTPTISESTGPATGGVTPITVALTLQGTYGQMSAFLRGLDTFPRLFTVTSIAVTGGPVASGGAGINPSTSGYSLNVTGDIYYRLGQQNVCTTVPSPPSPTAPPPAPTTTTTSTTTTTTSTTTTTTSTTTTAPAATTTG